jgi:SlyX protein
VNSADPAERRLAEAESRIAFLDDALDKLADAVARQDRELRDLHQQVRAMAERLRDLGDADAGGTPAGIPEPPPHY